MAHEQVITAADESPIPAVRTIGIAELKEALLKGIDDFWAMPSHAMFLSLIYPVVGVILGRLTFGYDVLPLLFPIIAGFALIGPFAAIGLYELSRRREHGLDVSWRRAFDVIYSPSFAAIAALGLLLMAIFVIWLATAQAIYIANFGYAPPESLQTFIRQIFTTPAGWRLIVIGNFVGFLFAVVVLTLSVVSFPLLLDRNVGVMAAVLTSVRAVLKNPVTMAVWGLIVACALAIGSLPLFFGLAVVMPVLGHATWHLYRRVVESDPNPPQEFRHPVKPRRYAADFPVSLFPARKDRP